MKYLIVVALLWSVNVYAEQAICETLKLENATSEQLARSGCCSHHGGVCGCSGDRAQCCDGALSPSCGCNKEDTKEIKSLEINQPKS